MFDCSEQRRMQGGAFVIILKFVEILEEVRIKIRYGSYNVDELILAIRSPIDNFWTQAPRILD